MMKYSKIVTSSVRHNHSDAALRVNFAAVSPLKNQVQSYAPASATTSPLVSARTLANSEAQGCARWACSICPMLVTAANASGPYHKCVVPTSGVAKCNLKHFPCSNHKPERVIGVTIGEDGTRRA
eukprot:6195826-Pleurochrysis_carterae.AAC.1